MKLGIRGQLTDVITCVEFLVDRFRGYGVLIPPKLPFPIDLLRRPYNSVALQRDTVILGVSCFIILAGNCLFRAKFLGFLGVNRGQISIFHFITPKRHIFARFRVF